MQTCFASLEATESFAASLAAIIQAPTVIHLEGDLGAGKTAFVRAFLRSLGVNGNIKSPTYALVEPYSVQDTDYYHFDLYRLSEAEDLEMIGIQDYFHQNSVCLIEWPDRGASILPKADVLIELEMILDSSNEAQRSCSVSAANSALNRKISSILQSKS